MGHIRFNGATFNLPNKDLENIQQEIVDGFKENRVTTITVTDGDGDKSTLFISPGNPITFHEWDSTM